jgi:hypothetical protein
MKSWINSLATSIAIRTANSQAKVPGPEVVAESESRRVDCEDEPTHLYSSDAPLTSKDQDRFGRWPFAVRIAETLANRADPSSLVVGLYGPWGDGKTSALQMMQEALKSQPRVVVVSFNPWHYGSEQQLLKGFFATLASALGKSLATWSEKMGDVLNKYGSILSVASVSVAQVVDINPGSAVAGVGAALSAVELDELKGRVESILREQKTRIVVLIDDIDRLDRSEIHAIFRLVKLSASFQYTSYVLAFDDEMVAAALGERYGGGGAGEGRKFLEKIVQVPLHLPPADEIELRQLTFQGVDAALTVAGVELSQERSEAFARHFVDGIEPHLRTPRQAKLYCNALTFALPLLKGEVDVTDLMLIEAIRVFFPRLYGAIRDNPDLFLLSSRGQELDQRRNRTRQLISESLQGSGLQEHECEQIRTRLLEPMFPRIGDMGYGSEWDAKWSQKKLIRARDYFQRYFSYAIPPGDVGDVELEAFLAEISNADVVKRMFLSWHSRRAVPRLISKLRQKDGSIPPRMARPLAIAIAANAQCIPREDGPMSFGGTAAQAAILISNSVKSLPPGEERVSTMQAVFLADTPVEFKSECWRWARHSKDDQESARVFSPDEEKQLEVALVEQIEALAKKGPLYEQVSQGVPSLLWIWAHVRGAEAVANAIRDWLYRSHEDPSRFLASYLGKAWGMESGLSRLADFRRESYDSIATCIDPREIYDRLRGIYGPQLDDPQFYQDEGTPHLLSVARQFAFIHEAVKGAESGTQASV